MKSSFCLAVGRVIRAGKVETNEHGRTHVSCIIELTRRHYNQTSYAQRVEVRCVQHQGLEELAEKLQEGLLVSAQGDVDAFVSDYNGRHFANLRITGFINEISEPDGSNHSS